MSDKDFLFEVLCVSTLDSTVIKTETGLAYSLLSNATLWINASLTESEIRDSNLRLVTKSVDIDSDFASTVKVIFSIKVEASFDRLEKFRIQLISHLKDQKFNKIYILSDEFSSEVAYKIYPSINRVENLLRKYLVKFFVTKLGSDWWKVTADSGMSKKANDRGGNETVFSSFTEVDSKVYLIDFGDLGEIVYSQSSGFISRQDIISKIMKLDETAESMSQLKQELQSNYTKFFKETFRDKNFQEKWQKLEKIRHKTAHNSLFELEDLHLALELTKSLSEIIQEADSKIDEVVFSQNEKAVLDAIIVDNVIENSSEANSQSGSRYKLISEGDLILILKEAEEKLLKDNGFVGLSNFVKNYVGVKGFDYRYTYDVISKLKERGIVEVYEETEKSYFPVKAIRHRVDSSFD